MAEKVVNEFHRVDRDNDIKRKKRLYKSQNYQFDRILEIAKFMDLEPEILEPEMNRKVKTYRRRKKEHPFKHWTD